MAQFHKVTKAFQSKDKATGEVTVDSYGNVKWMFQVENQGPEGWMSVNRKEGSELTEGSYVYGIIDTWPEGKAKFVRQQPPEGTQYPSDAPARQAQPAPAQQSSAPAQGGSTVEAKIDYLTSLVENFLKSQGAGPATANPVSQSAPTDDDAPVDLDQLEY